MNHRTLNYSRFVMRSHLLPVVLCCLAVSSSSAADNVLWDSSDGYWSDPDGWVNRAVPAGDASEGVAVVNANCTVTITNGDSAVSRGLWVSGGGELKMEGGAYTSQGNMLVGQDGVGTWFQSNGAASASDYLTLGQNANSFGRVCFLGGSFVQQSAIDNAGICIGYSGRGSLLVGGQANVTVNGNRGLWFSGKASSTLTNEVILASGGTLSAKCVTCGSTGTRTICLDGGTLRTMVDAPSFVKTGSLSEFGVTDRGGVVDTCGNDVTMNQPLTASDVSAVSSLAHRWSFNGNAIDSISIGEMTAVLDGGASLVPIEGYVKLPGGTGKAGAVDLGNNVLPTDDTGFTVELWGTLDEVKAWSRCFEIGSTGGAVADGADYFFFAWTRNSGASFCPCLGITYGATQNIVNGGTAFEKGSEYHIAVVVASVGASIWVATVYRLESGTGQLEKLITYQLPSGWSPANQNQDHFWLGRSLNSNDSDSACSYNEVRIYNRPLTEHELTLNDVAGPDVIDGCFTKTGAGTLTLTGENTFTAPIRVETGTLALAANATLAEDCDVAIATNAFLSLASSAYPKGGVAIEVNEHGQTGCISSTSTLDLSKLSITIANPSALSKDHRYTIVTSTGGFTGTFASIDIPESWSLSTSVNSITIKPKGLTIIFR